MRIATWNVNSLKARQEAVDRWLERAAPDILLMQETKLTDDDAPVMSFAMAGYQLVHHGEGRWNGVAIAARNGLAVSDVVTNFGDGPVRDSGPGAPASDAGEDDFDPFDEARMVAATVDGLRVVSLYAPNGRVVDSAFYTGKLGWFERLARWIRDEVAGGAGGSGTAGASGAGVGASGAVVGASGAGVGASLILGGDLNVAPTDADVWDPKAAHGGTHVSEPERVAFRALLEAGGLVDAYRARHDEPRRFTWWDYRAGMFHKNFGMRIDHLLVTPSVAARVLDAEIDREARKGPPVPSDHAPLSMDLDEPGKPFDPDWSGALSRIASRTR
jgi:exodeoxyribonuclease III